MTSALSYPAATPPTPPAIPHLEAGLAYLARLPLANPIEARNALSLLLDSLRLHPLPPVDYLLLLEQTRLVCSYVQEETARTFTERAVPLGDRENAAFVRVVEDWRRLAGAYAHCAQLVPREEPFPPEQLALILQRCLHCIAHALYDHYRARREAGAGLWLDLHGYYASAEEWGVANLPVEDPLNPGSGSTQAAATYVEALLLDLATPYALDLKALRFVRRLASRWAPLVQLLPVDAATPPRFAVNLLDDAGLHPVAATNQADLRRLETGSLTAQLQHTQAQLAHREHPAQLGLGEDMAADRCAHLVGQLSRPWSLTAAPRRYRRWAGSGTARVCSGVEAIYHFLHGRPFAQPTTIYSRESFERLYVFRHQVDPATDLEIVHAHQTQAVETWQVINQSATGFRLGRSRAGLRLTHNQLVAVIPPDGSQCLLGRATWLMEDREGGVVLGIAILPGLPLAAAVRPDLAGGKDEAYHPAFLLPGMPTVGQEASLVIPRGWYVNGRQLEVVSDGHRRVRLTRRLEQGVDFERVSFVPAG
ncbi:hypothetical protein OTERR_30910 [Oryzomicrobium terrae]|uniref:Molecular chaperone n=1 Tax=Oryzomicrobium terrae TaxID=1735038 RepID=A0A5C1EEJ3_9RHOO|nr:hypothetical protein [Oryzomicrobium terrae]QEL66567.1 hypothetical protein OTERR_30910 [Oryzomicrobium terrae]